LKNAITLKSLEICEVQNLLRSSLSGVSDLVANGAHVASTLIITNGATKFWNKYCLKKLHGRMYIECDLEKAKTKNFIIIRYSIQLLPIPDHTPKSHFHLIK
jgi:hypothetical protein